MHWTIKEKLYSVSNMEALGSSFNISGFPHTLVLTLSYVYVGALKGSLWVKGLPTVNKILIAITNNIHIKQVHITQRSISHQLLVVNNYLTMMWEAPLNNQCIFDLVS